tara:strand:+ start:19467 stop:19619 length:153 start_codon:yes stop_codon:yes gene_type:complete
MSFLMQVIVMISAAAALVVLIRHFADIIRVAKIDANRNYIREAVRQGRGL